MRVNWHARFLQQAQWTAALRQHLFARLDLTSARRILEPGCGTAAILASTGELLRMNNYSEDNEAGTLLVGLDLSFPFLQQAARHAPASHLVCGDAHALPLADAVFDLIYCHFLLLWLPDPALALRDMTRLARPGGWVLALAEPDYGGRIDYPAELEAPGRLQIQALRGQGADPHIGRRLAALFLQAGLKNVESGILGGQWQAIPGEPGPEWDQEWQVLASDLSALASPAELERWRLADLAARSRGERILYVPTFYALGQRT